MMPSLSPYLVQLLEAYEPKRLEALLHWLDPASPLIDEEPSTKEKEVPAMSVPPVENNSPNESACIDDLIAFSLLDEFGPEFMGKPAFQWLSRCIRQHVTAQANLG